MTTVQIITVIIMLCVLVAAVAYIAYVAGKRAAPKIEIGRKLSKVFAGGDQEDLVTQIQVRIADHAEKVRQLINNQKTQAREIDIIHKELRSRALPSSVLQIVNAWPTMLDNVNLMKDCTNSLKDRVRALEQCWDEYELSKPPDPSIQTNPTGIAKGESSPAPPDPGPIGPRAAIKLDQKKDKNRFAIAAVSDWMLSQNRLEFTATGRQWLDIIVDHTKHWTTGPYDSNGAGLMKSLKNHPDLMSYYRLSIEDKTHDQRTVRRV